MNPHSTLDDLIEVFQASAERLGDLLRKNAELRAELEQAAQAAEAAGISALSALFTGMASQLTASGSASPNSGNASRKRVRPPKASDRAPPGQS